MIQGIGTCAILTINDDGNYGNRLQNYALSETLSLFANVSTIRTFLRAESRSKRFLLAACLPVLNRNSILLDHKIFSTKVERERVRNYKSFSSRIPTGKYYLAASTGFEIVKSSHYPDRIIIGSDQVWNYRWLSNNDLRLRLGMFAPPNHLICYAASIGLDDIDEVHRPLFREGWSRIPHISVREDRAAELVEELSGRNAVVVLDPTLLLSREKWAEIFSGFVSDGDLYVLTYFLGRPSDSQESVILAMAQKLGARIRRVNDTRDLETYSAGPAEFVELVSKAQYVFTDSYHACCFSVLFNRPFKVFCRTGSGPSTNMNSRMRTLFRLFQIADFMKSDETLAKFDWENINSLLNLHRKQSLAWLESTLYEGSESNVCN